jgi:hypothetical protein
MREIKFRGWSNEEKKYYYDNIGGTIKNKEIFIGSVGYFNGIIQQFTGLKDSKGIEVYEGDIIQYFVKGEVFGRFVVKWNDEGFWDYGINLSKSKVIGNIYENPELLTPNHNQSLIN